MMVEPSLVPSVKPQLVCELAMPYLPQGFRRMRQWQYHDALRNSVDLKIAATLERSVIPAVTESDEY